jgi:hypothetical protein
MLVLLILQKGVVAFAGDYVAHIKVTVLLIPNASDSHISSFAGAAVHKDDR